MKDWILTDLDGTLANCEHRLHHAQRGDWDAFYASIDVDRPNNDVVTLLKSMSKEHDILCVTGRPERYRARTLFWMNEYEIPCTTILMRPDGDWRSDHVLKIAMARDWFSAHFGPGGLAERVLFCLDDRDKVVEAWRAAGIPCFQVRPGGY